jgi:hypothetical protein
VCTAAARVSRVERVSSFFWPAERVERLLSNKQSGAFDVTPKMQPRDTKMSGKEMKLKKMNRKIRRLRRS